jgi:hypothetical protein
MDEQGFFNYIHSVMSSDENNILEYVGDCGSVTLSCRRCETSYDVYSLFVIYHDMDEAWFVKVYIEDDAIAYSWWSSKYGTLMKRYPREDTMEELKIFFPLDDDMFEVKEPSVE